MWRIPSPLIAGQSGVFVETFTSDTYIGDLYVYLMSPTVPVDVEWTVDGCDLGEIIIPNTFAAGSSFTFICVNSGRICGVGGAGGFGADDYGTYGGNSGPGFNGGHAIQSTGFAVSVDVDDGYLLGGGGGGGGGSYNAPGGVGTDVDAGGGGGGGQGFYGGAGGAAGASIGVPAATAGSAGSVSTFGLGGKEGRTNANSGGNGGKWGSGGQLGKCADLMLFQFPYLVGGAGGRAGNAFMPVSGASIAYDGVKSEATLRSEGRIKGCTSSFIPAYNGEGIVQEYVDISVAGSNQTGVTFQTNGNLLRGNLSSTPTTITNRWLTATNATEAAKYEIRERNGDGNGSATNPLTTSQDVSGTWNTRINVTPGTWTTLLSARTQSITSATGVDQAGTIMEIRRNDVPGNPDDEIICTFAVYAVDENAS